MRAPGPRSSASTGAAISLAAALALGGLCPSALAAPGAPPSSRYEGLAAFRGPRVPAGGAAVARLSREPADYVYVLPQGAKPADGAPLLGAGPWQTGRLLVELEGAGDLEGGAREAARRAGASFVRGLSVGRWALLDAGTPERVPAALAVLAADPLVARAEPEMLRRLEVHSPLDDELFPLQWHLENTWQRAYPRVVRGADIRARDAWQLTTGDPDVVIAVIDTGQDTFHPDFAEPGKIVAPLDTTDLSSDASPPPFESSGAHGIACAGLAAASREGTTGVVGVCPDCSVMPIRLFNETSLTTDTAIVDAFVHARQAGASIASNSWGLGGETLSAAVLDALGAFVEEGRGGLGGVVVFAMGNSYGEVLPSELATDPRVLGVGGTGADDERVAYSTWGEGLDVVAPAGHDLVFDEQGNPSLESPLLVTTDRPGDDGYGPALDDFLDPGLLTDPDYTATMTGTSAACPLVAGLAGLLLSLEPGLRYEQVFALIRDHADKVGPVTYDASGWHPEYGSGRINAFASLSAAASGTVCQPAPEDCADGVDNDCDGSADARDEDCGFVLPAPDVPVGAACRWVETDGCGDGFCWGFESSGDGICSITCHTGECPQGSICVSTDDATGNYPLCFAPCASDADCAEGASCVVTYEGRVCHPLCGFPPNSVCPDGLRCEEEGAPCVGDIEPPPQDGGPAPEPDAGPGVVDGGEPGGPRKVDRLRIAPVATCQSASGGLPALVGLLGLLVGLTRRGRRRGP